MISEEMKLNLYEGMYIFPEAMEEDAIDAAVKVVGKEIEKLGGVVESTARIGKRKFARQLDKQDFGYYVVMNFELEPDKVEQLRNRFKLNENILRAQIVRADEGDPVAEQVDSNNGGNDNG